MAPETLPRPAMAMSAGQHTPASAAKNRLDSREKRRKFSAAHSSMHTRSTASKSTTPSCMGHSPRGGGEARAEGGRGWCCLRWVGGWKGGWVALNRDTGRAIARTAGARKGYTGLRGWGNKRGGGGWDRRALLTMASRSMRLWTRSSAPALHAALVNASCAVATAFSSRT